MLGTDIALRDILQLCPSLSDQQTIKHERSSLVMGQSALASFWNMMQKTCMLNRKRCYRHPSMTSSSSPGAFDPSTMGSCGLSSTHKATITYWSSVRTTSG